MASVSKTVAGATTTFTVTDAAGNAATMAVNQPAGGPTLVTFGGAAVNLDAAKMMANLLLQVETGLVPGAGAQGLQP